METVVLEYRDEASAKADLELLWAKSGVTGEILRKPDNDGTWYLEVTAEGDIPPALFAKLKGRRP